MTPYERCCPSLGSPLGPFTEDIDSDALLRQVILAAEDGAHEGSEHEVRKQRVVSRPATRSGPLGKRPVIPAFKARDKQKIYCRAPYSRTR